MGKKDTVTKAYMSRADVFADAFNQYVYKGRQVIAPKSLVEMDTAQIALPYGKDDAALPQQKTRDVQKLMLSMTDGRTAYCILALENESKVHYAIPVKNGLYDFMQLSAQVSEAARQYRRSKGKNLTSDEYMSGFRREDRLLPVMTLVFYFGADEWDGPLNLRDMYRECDRELLQYVPDYHVNLIAPYHMTDAQIDLFQTNLREITRYIKYSKNKIKLNDVLMKDARFRSVDREAAELINVVTGSTMRYSGGEEKINMCLALEQIKEDSKLEGRQEGKLEGEIIGAIRAYQKIGMSKPAVAQYIADEFDKTIAEAQQIIEQYWK